MTALTNQMQHPTSTQMPFMLTYLARKKDNQIQDEELEKIALGQYDSNRETFKKIYYEQPFYNGVLINFSTLYALPKVAELANDYGKSKLIFCVDVLLQILQKTLNHKNAMNSYQNTMCAMDIVNTSIKRNLRFEELLYFFSEIPLGTFGKIYDRIDQSVIFEFLNTYLEQRHNAFIEWKSNQKQHTL